MSTLPPLPSDISKIAGPLIIAFCLHWGFFGALSAQVYVYYLAFPNEPPKRKILVYGIYAIELAQTILVMKVAFKEFAAGFGSYQALNDIGLCWFVAPILSSIVEFIVQIFYAYRIRILAESNLIPMVVVLFAFIQLGGAIGGGVIAHQAVLFSKFLMRKTFIVIGIWNASGAVCDMIIAISMTYYLSRLRIRLQMASNCKPTQQVAHRLMHLFIETGLFTATIAIINLALFLIPGHPTYWQTPMGILGKIYSTTMMAVLNNRIVFQIQDEFVITNEHLSFDPGVSSDGSILATRDQRTGPLDVYKMHRTTTELG